MCWGRIVFKGKKNQAFTFFLVFEFKRNNQILVETSFRKIVDAEQNQRKVGTR